MGPIEALEMALAKEIEAVKIYEGFSFKYPETKDIFTFLKNEEEKHEQMIEKRIAELKNK